MARVKKAPANPITAADREVFAEHLRAWQGRLGLHSWRINLSSKRPIKGAAADVTCYHTDHLAVVTLGPDLGSQQPTPENLEAYAVHELLHVLLAPLVDQAASGLTGDALAADEHRVIHVLQKLLTKAVI